MPNNVGEQLIIIWQVHKIENMVKFVEFWQNHKIRESQKVHMCEVI
jgi:hypothetical protein